MKYLKFLGIFFLLFMLFVPSTHAQSGEFSLCAPREIINSIPFLKDLLVTDRPWYDQTVCQFKEKVFNNDPSSIFGERYTYAQINWIFNSLQLLLNPLYTGFGDKLQKLFTYNSNIQDFSKFGLTGLIFGSISDMYQNPPASGTEAISTALAKFDIATPAHAAGYGFTSIGAVQSLWSVSRNMTYLLMVVILIASGFMIMFRVKINPQTVVSLQSMIPKLVVTLILVTFSYAIAGLMIELAYVLVMFVIALITASPTKLLNDPAAAIRVFTTPNFLSIVLYYLGFVGMLTVTLLPTIIGPVLGLIAFIFLIWNLIKIWWMMVKAYLTLMLQIIIAPLQIMLGLLPGQDGFGSWFRNFISNLSVFVVVPIMFLINILFWQPTLLAGNEIYKWFLDNVVTGAAFGAFLSDYKSLFSGINPTKGEFPNFPLFGNTGILFNLAIGYAFLALIPKVADMIRDALKVPAFKYGTAFGEAVESIPGFKTTRTSAEQLGKKAAIVQGGGIADSVADRTGQGWIKQTYDAFALENKVQR